MDFPGTERMWLSDTWPVQMHLAFAFFLSVIWLLFTYIFGFRCWNNYLILSAAAGRGIQMPHFKYLEGIHGGMSLACSGSTQSIFRQCLQFHFMFLSFSLIFVVRGFSLRAYLDWWWFAFLWNVRGFLQLEMGYKRKNYFDPCSLHTCHLHWAGCFEWDLFSSYLFLKDLTSLKSTGFLALKLFSQHILSSTCLCWISSAIVLPNYLQ